MAIYKINSFYVISSMREVHTCPWCACGGRNELSDEYHDSASSTVLDQLDVSPSVV
jgi:hypothetical protein